MTIPQKGGLAMRSLNVLVADDDQGVRGLVKDILRMRGMTVREAVDGQEAVEALESGEHFDLLVTDYQMPRRDGLAVIAAAKQTIPGIKAILLTGGGTDPITAREHGADAVLFKPFALDRFRETLDRLFPPVV